MTPVLWTRPAHSFTVGEVALYVAFWALCQGLGAAVFRWKSRR